MTFWWNNEKAITKEEIRKEGKELTVVSIINTVIVVIMVIISTKYLFVLPVTIMFMWLDLTIMMHINRGKMYLQMILMNEKKRRWPK